MCARMAQQDPYQSERGPGASEHAVYSRARCVSTLIYLRDYLGTLQRNQPNENAVIPAVYAAQFNEALVGLRDDLGAEFVRSMTIPKRSLNVATESEQQCIGLSTLITRVRCALQKIQSIYFD